ncbi:MAG: DNA ligase, partial [archaeon]|nr:DNA ligase [archaeon]
MDYKEFADVYDSLGKTTKRLEKTAILAEFLKKLKKEGKSEWIYLLNGRVVPDFDPREIGISTQLTLKAIAQSFGIKEEEVIRKFKKVGDLGEIAEEFSEKKRQTTLGAKKLSVAKVFDNLRRVMEIEGKGAVDRKLGLISELLANASGREAKYIVRTMLSDLRVGVSVPTIVDALALAFLKDEENASEKIQSAYDLANDFAVVFDVVSKGNLKALEKIAIEPGKPLNVMLAVKVSDIKEA